MEFQLMPGANSGGMAKTICLASAFALLARLPLALAADPRVGTWVSPDRRVVLSSVRNGGDGDGFFQLSLTRAGQRPVVVDEYLRDIDVQWSANSNYVAVTDWIGSNVADCYVIDTARPEKKISVTTTLPKTRENITNSHYYVSCQGWEGENAIVVEAAGHTDYPPYHGFRYLFLLDVRAGRARRL